MAPSNTTTTVSLQHEYDDKTSISSHSLVSRGSLLHWRLPTGACSLTEHNPPPPRTNQTGEKEGKGLSGWRRECLYRPSPDVSQSASSFVLDVVDGAPWRAGCLNRRTASRVEPVCRHFICYFCRLRWHMACDDWRELRP